MSKLGSYWRNFVLLFLGSLTTQFSLAAGNIQTLAGSGVVGVGSDNVQATLSPLNAPRDMVLDAAGNLYIADSQNHSVRRIDLKGFITTYAGNGVLGFSGDGGAATAAQLNLPSDLAVDSLGNLYIADTGNHRVRMVDPNGIITSVAGDGTAAYGGDLGMATLAQLNGPSGIAIDASDNLYIADSNNHRIRKVDPSGVITTVVGVGVNNFAGDGGLATVAKLNLPSDVEVDGSGNLYILDRWYGYVRRVDALTGIITTVAGNLLNGNVRCTPQPCYNGDNIPATSADLSGPFGLSLDLWGNLYIADTENHRVRRVDQNGVMTTIAGTGVLGFNGDGVAADTANLYRPYGVLVDSASNLYIADRDNHRLRKVLLDTQAPSGSLTLPVAINSLSVPVTLSCQDDLSGCAEMRLSNDGVTWGGWSPYATSSSWMLTAKDGLKSVFVQFRDGLGQDSGVVSSSTMLDTVRPAMPLISQPISPSYTPVATQSISGRAEAGDLLELFANGLSVALVNVDASGNWQLNHTFTEGHYLITAVSQDIAGNLSPASAAVTLVVDQTAPQITQPLTLQLEASAAQTPVSLTPPTVTDLSPVILTHNGPTSFPTGTTVITWSAVDAAGNSSLASQTVQLLDTTPPGITLNGASNLQISVGGFYNELGATAFDLVDGDLSTSIRISGSVNPAVMGIYTLQYTVSDVHGNQATVARTVEVKDLNAPLLSLNGGDLTLEAGGPFSDPGATAIDNQDGDLTASIVVTSTVDPNLPGNYSLSYQVTDQAGNSSQLIRQVNVVDTTPPTLTLPADLQLEASGRLTPVAVGNSLASDLFAVTVSSDAPAEFPVGVTVVTWSAVDAYGNHSSAEQRVSVVDTTPPVLTLVDGTFLQLEATQPYREGVISATDLVDGDLIAQVVLSGNVNVHQPGLYTLIYSVTDSAGNRSEVQRSVEVVDTIAPLLQLTGPARLQWEAGVAYLEPGVIASDGVDGDLTAAVLVSGQVNPLQLGDYNLSYLVQDSSGNSATVLNRVVSVVDTLSPTLTLLGANPLYLEAGQAYQEPGFSAVDLFEGELRAVVDVINPVDSFALGRYRISYSVTDSSGNRSLIRQRDVVVQDTTAPLLIAPPDLSVEIDQPQIVLDLGQPSVDDLFLQSVGNDAPSQYGPGEYLVVWYALDSSDNRSEAMQRVSVIDPAPPVLTLSGELQLQMMQGESFIEPGYSAVDSVDGDLSAAVVVSGVINTQQPGHYSISYSVSDSSGNVSMAQSREVWVIGLNDQDGDGVVDDLDQDADNDGIPNTLEGAGDSDGDGVPDWLDLDSDNDGLPDLLEVDGQDLNFDGQLDQFVDLNGDGLYDFLVTSPLDLIDTDGDGTPDYLDLDSDGDGLPDLLEVGGVDYDNDGRIDGFVDSDGDGLADQFNGGRQLTILDTDGDGIPDHLDDDVRFKVQSSISGAGSSDPLLLLGLMGFWLLRRYKMVIYPILPILAFTPIGFTRADTVGELDLTDSGWRPWSVMVVSGVSILKPKTNQFGIEISDQNGSALGVAGGYRWRRDWVAEGFWLDLGEARLRHRLSQIGGLGKVAYKAYGISINYLLTHSKKVIPYLKGGVYQLESSASDTRMILDQPSREGIHWGGGLLWQQSPNWGVRFDYSHFGTDAQLVALGLQYTWGKESDAAQTLAGVADDGAQVVSFEAEAPCDSVQEGQQNQADCAKEADMESDEVVSGSERCGDAQPGSFSRRPSCLEVGAEIHLRQEILFAIDSYLLSASDKLLLDDIAARLLANPRERLLLEGHTDNSGSVIYNQKLSARRANAVSDYLKSLGVKVHQLSVRAYGELMPMMDNATEEGRRMNRRVEIHSRK